MGFRRVLFRSAALASTRQGRFVLGFGASSESVVRGWNDIDFDRPVTQLGRTGDFVRSALAGAPPPARPGDEGSFSLGALPERSVPIHIAALGPRMLQLAGELGGGVWLNLVPPGALKDEIGRAHV